FLRPMSNSDQPAARAVAGLSLRVLSGAAALPDAAGSLFPEILCSHRVLSRFAGVPSHYPPPVLWRNPIGPLLTYTIPRSFRDADVVEGNSELRSHSTRLLKGALTRQPIRRATPSDLTFPGGWNGNDCSLSLLRSGR